MWTDCQTQILILVGESHWLKNAFRWVILYRWSFQNSFFFEIRADFTLWKKKLGVSLLEKFLGVCSRSEIFKTISNTLQIIKPLGAHWWLYFIARSRKSFFFFQWYSWKHGINKMWIATSLIITCSRSWSRRIFVTSNFTDRISCISFNRCVPASLLSHFETSIDFILASQSKSPSHFL